ncbi:MAG: hypothetical protein AAF517_14870, partial [Planctomycetota bacterium]
MRTLLVCALLLFSSLWVSSLRGEDCSARVESLTSIEFSFNAAQGVAVDTDGSLWVTSGLSLNVYHLSPRLEILDDGFEADFPELPQPAIGAGITGITMDPEAGTLFMARPSADEIREFERDGTPTGLVIRPVLPPPPNIIPRPFIKGLAYDALGDGGRGSIWLVESITTAIYEISRDGAILRSFCHPDDPDGCPGAGTAAPGGDLALLRDDEGRVTGFDLLGGEGTRDRIRRVDTTGIPDGTTFLIDLIGGVPSGFARGSFEVEEGVSRDVYFVLNESSSSLHVLSFVEPQLKPFLEFQCARLDQDVQLEWRNTDVYDSITVYREGELLEVLAGGASDYVDENPPEGMVEYRVVAARGDCSYGETCEVLRGAGEVLRSAFLNDVVGTEVRAVDLTEDDFELLWVTQSEPVPAIHVFNKDFELQVTYPSPFPEEDAIPSGIAFRFGHDTLFVYDNSAQRIAEMDTAGEVLEIFESGLPNPDEEDGPFISSMLYDPDGDEGNGSLWLLDARDSTIYERTLSGETITSCTHPDEVADPAPPGTIARAYSWGFSVVPGSDFSQFDVSGGRVHDPLTTRIFLGDANCERSAAEIPLDDVARFASTFFIGQHRTERAGEETLFVLSTFPGQSWLFEVETAAPTVPFVSDLRCRQPSPDHGVELSFLAPGGVDSFEVYRDAELVDTIPGVAEGSQVVYQDTTEAGIHKYSVRSVRGELRSDDRSCTLRVGVGAVVRRVISSPVSAISHLVRYRVGEEVKFIGASKSHAARDDLHVFDSNLHWERSFPSPFPRPLRVAGLALREVVVDDHELYVLGWNPGVSSGDPIQFPVHVLDPVDGATLRSFEIETPLPDPRYVQYPAGMAWDPLGDSLWVLERNANTLSEFDLTGEVIRHVPHPDPIHQDRVEDVGLEFRGDTNSLFVTSGGREDRKITRLVEATRDGVAPGFEIPIGDDHASSFGFALNETGDGFVVGSLFSGFSEFVEYRADNGIAPVRDVRGAWGGGSLEISWQNGDDYEFVDVYRGRELATTLAGESSWIDDRPA